MFKYGNVSLLKCTFLCMHSVVGWGSFCMNYCINARHGVDQPSALLRCNESLGGFDSSLQLVCIVWSHVSHLPLTIPHTFSMGFRSVEFAGQSAQYSYHH